MTETEAQKHKLELKNKKSWPIYSRTSTIRSIIRSTGSSLVRGPGTGTCSHDIYGIVHELNEFDVGCSWIFGSCADCRVVMYANATAACDYAENEFLTAQNVQMPFCVPGSMWGK